MCLYLVLNLVSLCLSATAPNQFCTGNLLDTGLTCKIHLQPLFGKRLPACPPAYRAPAGLPWNSRSDLQHTHSLLNPAWTLTLIPSTKLLTSFLQVGKHPPYLYSPIVLCITIVILTALSSVSELSFRDPAPLLSPASVYTYISRSLCLNKVLLRTNFALSLLLGLQPRTGLRSSITSNLYHLLVYQVVMLL